MNQNENQEKDVSRKGGSGTQKKLVGAAAVVLLLALAAVGLSSLQNKDEAPAVSSGEATEDTAQLVLPETAEPVEVEENDISEEAGETIPTPTMDEVMDFFAEGAPAKGPEDAPVTVVEFSDYMCPYCGYFNLETLPQIMEAYPDEVRFVHRDFLNFGEASYNVAHSVACAADQDLYWEMREEYFLAFEGMDLEDFQAMHGDEEAFMEFISGYTQETIVEYADAAGLEMDSFLDCMSGQKYQEQIAFDYQLASQMQINGIPFFIVNGTVVSGAVPFEDFSKIIDTALEEYEASH